MRKGRRRKEHQTLRKWASDRGWGARASDLERRPMWVLCTVTGRPV